MQNRSFRAGNNRSFKNKTRNNYRRPNSPHKRRGGNKQSIHPSKFINKATTPIAEEVFTPKNSFKDFALNDKIKRTLEYLKYKTPTPVQDEAIPMILNQQDVIALANTGTGKTAAFLLPTIQKLLTKEIRNSVLILAPTRELAQQIDEEFRRFGAGLNLYSTVCVGGMNITKQIRSLKRGPHIIIGTPGRIKDLISRRVLILSAINTFILDEADRMLDMGFVNDIRLIANLLPNDRQTLCFSATMTKSVKTIIDDFMKQPTTISVCSRETSEHINQDIIEATDKFHKLELLVELLQKDQCQKVVVFGETKYGVQRLSDKLCSEGLLSAAIHGNKSQSQRQRALDDFKKNKVNILVATDVAARGLDIPNVSHVINFDQPATYDDYIHRIGRTGRAGNIGQAYTFVDAKK